MKFIPLGDTEGIGASCHFLDIEGTGLVLDAGSDPRREGRASMPRFDIIHDHAERYIDHAIVSHAHHDHMGGVPVLIQEFPHVIVHMTDATQRLLDFLLPASARLQKRKKEKGETSHAPLFDEDEVEMYSQLFLTHALETPFDVTGLRGATPIQAQLYTAGHILGSVGVELSFKENGQTRRLFFTGDTNAEGQSIIPGASYPDETDILVLESTLGDDAEMERTTRELEVQKFKDALERVVGRGGTALIPVFVMGRAQETLALLHRFKQEGVIPSDVPVYTAGSMRAIADVYDKTRSSTPRVDSDFKVFGVDLRRQLGRGRVVVDRGRGAVAQARKLVEDSDNAILLVGYAVEDTPAHRLKEAASEGFGTEVTLHPDTGPQPINCEVGNFRLSGHSDRRALLDLVDRLQPSQVVLVHGEPEARTWMANNIKHFHPDITVHQPEWGTAIDL